jgi:hypothetical protein
MTEKRYARLAGVLFLWLIVAGIGGMFLMTVVARGGTFAEKAQRIAEWEHVYRTGLVIELSASMSGLLLAFVLYVLLRPIDELQARFAMYWRLGESILGTIGVLAGFVKLRLYLSGGEASLELVRFASATAVMMSATFFSIGSLLFFRLFARSPYLPRALAHFGMFASVVVTAGCLTRLIAPEMGSILVWITWLPMAVAEVGSGVWLIATTRERTVMNRTTVAAM